MSKGVIPKAAHRYPERSVIANRLSRIPLRLM
jgi:hypothetical protein